MSPQKPNQIKEKIRQGIPVSAKSGKDEQPISGKTNRYFLILFNIDDDINRKTVIDITKLLETTIKTENKSTEIDLWIESPGGDAHSAFKIATSIQIFASKFRVVIPDFAKSAATLLALGADEIYMSKTSELGPIDAQIEHPLVKDKRVSSLDVAKGFEHLADIAVSLVLRSGPLFLKTTGLERQETVSLLLKFASDLMRPMIEQLDPVLIHRAADELRISEEYSKRLLTSRNNYKHIKAATISKRLVERYPSHSFVITPNEAKERVGLRILNAEDYDYWATVLNVYYQAMETKESLIRLMDEREMIKFVKKLKQRIKT